MIPFTLLLGIICTASALPYREYVVVIESSNEKAKVGRFIFAATVTETAFSTTVVVTASSITHQFCFSIANADDNCASNMLLPGKKRRRRDAIEEQPSKNWKLMLDNEEIDFDEFVAQLKPAAPRQAKAVVDVPQRLEFKRIEVEGLDEQCFTGPAYDGRGRQADTQPRFVTFRTTVTTGTTSTTTVVTTTAGQITQSLWFSSTSGCFPSSILSSLSSIGPSLGQCG
jgi:hypothetical protein